MSIEIENLGRIDYSSARLVQERRIENYRNNLATECFFICEHPAVVTKGKRSQGGDILSPAYFLEKNIPIIETDRGGEATYHGPGQLVIYPVIDLRSRNIGVKKIVSLGLEIISETVDSLGLPTVVSLEKAGVWLKEKDRKIASVGLRIIHGLTNHGFSLNVSSDLAVYDYFTPCGLRGENISSIQHEIGASQLGLFELGYKISLAFSDKLE